MSLAVLNGNMVEITRARLSIDDRGFLLGDGLFETLRAYRGKAFCLELHLHRLFNSCAAFNLRLPWSERDLGAFVSELISVNKLDSARIRITVTRGRHTGAMSLAPAASPTLLITAEPIPEGLEQRMGRGLKLMSAQVRFSEHNPVFKHKSLNRLAHLLARTRAKAAGGDEALILDEKGNVACCSTANVFALQYGQLFTPPLAAPILPGVTRKVVLDLARTEGVPIREDYFSPIIFAGADEAFMTNSVVEIVPVVKVNQRPAGSGRPGPLTARLRRKYRELAEQG